jgi:hypothetical protein
MDRIRYHQLNRSTDPKTPYGFSRTHTAPPTWCNPHRSGLFKETVEPGGFSDSWGYPCMASCAPPTNRQTTTVGGQKPSQAGNPKTPFGLRFCRDPFAMSHPSERRCQRENAHPDPPSTEQAHTTIQKNRLIRRHPMDFFEFTSPPPTGHTRTPPTGRIVWPEDTLWIFSGSHRPPHKPILEYPYPDRTSDPKTPYGFSPKTPYGFSPKGTFRCRNAPHLASSV